MSAKTTSKSAVRGGGNTKNNDGDLILKWDPRNLEIRTKSVERTLAPLVTQVTTLVESSGPSNKKKGKSKKAHVLVAAVEKAIENFLEKGNEIVRDNPEAAVELNAALDEVKSTGNEMVIASRDFAQDPCSSQRRQVMVKAARALLSAVTRLLIVADMIDVHLLLKAAKDIKGLLEAVATAGNQDELLKRLALLRNPLDKFHKDSARRAGDLLNPYDRDDMHAARAALKTASPILYTASKAYVRHPEVDPARMNRDFAYGEMNKALNAVEDVLKGGTPRTDLRMDHRKIGDLAAALNEFDQRVFIDPHLYKASVMRPSLEEQLERIISGVALIADKPNTREDRKNRIVDECNNVRQALQDLLSEYEKNAGRKEPSEELDIALVHLNNATKGLRRHLRRAVVDHVSDNFLDTQVPLLMLIEAARRGDQASVDIYGRAFLEHAAKLVEVAELACSMSSNEEGVKMVRYAAMQVEKLAPQVVNAARLLAARPESKPAQENMEAFKDAWEERVRILTLAVDSIITLDDFLAVSEAHVVEDVKACIQAIVVMNKPPPAPSDRSPEAEDARLARQHAPDDLDRSAGAIRGRSLRVCQVVDADMELRQPDAYTERVRQAVRMLRNNALPEFARTAELAVEKLNRNPAAPVDEEEFINAATLVHTGIQDIRHAILMNRDPGDIDSDEEYEEMNKSEKSGSHAPSDRTAGGTVVPPGDNQRLLMTKLPEEEKKKIQEQYNVFKIVQHKFEREVARWDEAGNDIVVLAKYMCMIMMEMTDFTRGRGPLKTTMDVINAAKKISEAGTKLNALAKQVADESVESETKKDLLAYLQRITLYCHQLNITSKVKADVQQVGDELIVSGLESATSLIQAAKNLLNAVVLTVKSAYIASTKYPAKAGKQSSLVVWKMRAPDKKPLVRKETKTHGVIRRASQRRELQPIKVLAEFSPGADAV